MYRQRERRREGGTEHAGSAVFGAKRRHPIGRSIEQRWTDGRSLDGRTRADTFEMRDIGPSGPSGEAPWGEDNDGSVGAREGGFDLLACRRT